MPNNNKKTRGSNMGSTSNQGNPGVGHSSGSGSSSNREDRGSRGNSDRGNQGMGDHGSSRRIENIDSDRSSGK